MVSKEELDQFKELILNTSSFMGHKPILLINIISSLEEQRDTIDNQNDIIEDQSRIIEHLDKLLTDLKK